MDAEPRAPARRVPAGNTLVVQQPRQSCYERTGREKLAQKLPKAVEGPLASVRVHHAEAI